MVVSNLFGGQPAPKKGSKKKAAPPAKQASEQLGLGSRLWSAFGGGGKDMTNISSHPDYESKPGPLSSDDKRSFARKIGDELLGKTVGGTSFGTVVKKTKTSGPPPPTQKRGTGPKTSVVAKPSRTVVKAGRATAPASGGGGPMKSARMESAGYTTSAPNKNWSGFTYGSKSSAKGKVAAAKRTKTGASHDTKGLSFFRNKKD